MADKRRYFTLKEKKAHVAAYRAGNLGIREYCEQEGTPGASSLGRWCRQISEGGRARPKSKGGAGVCGEQLDALLPDQSVVGALRRENAMLKKMLAQVWAEEA